MTSIVFTLPDYKATHASLTLCFEFTLRDNKDEADANVQNRKVLLYPYTHDFHTHSNLLTCVVQ